MGVAVTLVVVLTSAINWPIYHFILVPTHSELIYYIVFILTIAAAEAALALGLIVLLYRLKDTLSAEAWSELRE